MKKWFEHRDGSRDLIEDVLSGKSRKAIKYAPITMYRLIGKDRPWKGGEPRIGVTRAQNGTRHEFLKYVFPYAVSVDDTIWMVLGITGHAQLEEGEGVEQFVEFDGIRGRSDLVETIKTEDGDFNILTDYKVSGSYAVVKTLGVREDGRRPVLDAEGNPVLLQKKSKYGEKGDPKTEPNMVMNLKKGEVFKYAMQTNMYRIMFERSGTPIHEMRIFFIVRDGNTQVAKGRGIKYTNYYVPMPTYDDEKVLEYFRKKRDELHWRMDQSALIRGNYATGQITAEVFLKEANALEVLPPPCDKEEAWDGRRCTGGFCPVAEYCKMIGDAPYFPKTRERRETQGGDKDLENF